MLAVEFEPGIIDAYEGEDKMSAVLAAMDRAEFWLSDLKLRGTLRMSPDEAARLGGTNRRGCPPFCRPSPGWGEMTYLNTFRGSGPFSKRDWLLGWVIACMNEQFGFALDLCRRAHVAVPDPLFGSLAAETDRMIREKLRSGRTAVHRPNGGPRGCGPFGGRVLKPGRSGGSRRGESEARAEIDNEKATHRSRDDD